MRISTIVIAIWPTILAKFIQVLIAFTQIVPSTFLRAMYRRLTGGECASMIKNCTTLSHLKSIHAAMIRSHLHPTLSFLTTHLISQYSQFGSIHHAQTLFSTSTTRNNHDQSLYTSLIRAYTDHGPPTKALELYRQMKDTFGSIPDGQTYPTVIRACSQLGDLDQGERVHRDADEDGFGRNVAVINALIAMYGKCGCFDVAKDLFDKMPEKTTVSWSAMIGACEKNGRLDEGVEFFSRMLGEGVKPNRGAFVNVMHCVSRDEDADMVYRMVVEDGLWEDVIVQNAAVRMYVRCGRVERAWEVFDKMGQRGLVVWNSMIEGYAWSDSPVEALCMFGEMKTQGLLPDYTTIGGIIHASSSLGSVRVARSVHGIVLKSIYEEDVGLENALVRLYVNCSSLQIARRLFDYIYEKDSESWSIMISGYGMHGMGKETVELLEQMKASIKPDDNTLLSVLSAYSLSGLVEEGQEFFNSMNEKFGIDPKPEHYACMVDLMGRTGQLKEAQEFIKNMPIEPDSSVWKSLLIASKIHMDVEVAEVAARSLLDLDSESSSSYVLLSNIYSYRNKQEEADLVASLMNERRVRQASSHSFVEVSKDIYKFVSGDRSNSQTDAIYKNVARLMESIRSEGYVCNKNLILHDIEEETKEDLLHAHSEKLAIAFALLNSEPESEILVSKNLSLCADCHTFAKYVSKVTNRTILIRDYRRFHHIKDGICSCRDYW